MEPMVEFVILIPCRCRMKGFVCLVVHEVVQDNQREYVKGRLPQLLFHGWYRTKISDCHGVGGNAPTKMIAEIVKDGSLVKPQSARLFPNLSNSRHRKHFEKEREQERHYGNFQASEDAPFPCLVPRVGKKPWQ